MRTREEIEYIDCDDIDDVGLRISYQNQLLREAQLEVLLDIRDLLTQSKTDENIKSNKE